MELTGRAARAATREFPGIPRGSGQDVVVLGALMLRDHTRSSPNHGLSSINTPRTTRCQSHELLRRACTALFDRWVFSGAWLVSFMDWNTLIPVCYGLIATAPARDFAGWQTSTDDA